MIRYGQDIQFVIHYDAIFIFAEREQESFIEPRFNLVEGVSPVPLVSVHRDGVKLFETGHRAHQEDYESSSLDSFDGPAKKIGVECFEILKDEHLEGVS